MGDNKSDGKKLELKQTRSEIGRNPEIRRTLRALGLGRIGKSKTIASNPAVKGMVRKVAHLLDITER